MTLTASHAFMLPVSTGPNAIMFGPSGLTIAEMAKVGFIMNLATLATTLAAISTYGTAMFDLGSYPDWASNSTGLDVMVEDRCQDIGPILSF